jgi:DNA-binding TFAR19-related protein (PDSD5 family)
MLNQYLKKLGIKSYDDLNADEKATYKEMEKAFEGKEITNKEVQEWLNYELDLAVSRLTDINLTKEDEIFRKVEVRFIKKLINLIESPKIAKQMAEKHLEQLIK